VNVNSPEDKLLKNACLKLKKLINSRGQRDVCLDAFVLLSGGKYYAVKVSQVAQKPDAVFHLTVYNHDGVFKTATMTTGGAIAELVDDKKKRPA
jgi:hypothetical protein